MGLICMHVQSYCCIIIFFRVEYVLCIVLFVFLYASWNQAILAFEIINFLTYLRTYLVTYSLLTLIGFWNTRTVIN